MPAGLTLWDQAGTVIYQNPAFMLPLAEIAITNYVGSASMPYVGGKAFAVLGFGEVNKRVGSYDNWVGGGISFINSMCNVTDGTINWNIVNDSKLMLGGYKGPFRDPFRGRLFVFVR